MVHSIVHIKASPKQLSKLRNGHKVRVSPVMEGEGFNLIVHPSNYDIISRSFSKNKGVNIQLSPEEILSNKGVSPEQHQEIKKQNDAMSGKGIFGKKFDDFVERKLGKKEKDMLYKTADKLKPTLKSAINKASEYAPQLGAEALSALAVASGNPELVPIVAPMGYKAGEYVGKKGAKYATDYLDNPRKYQHHQTNAGGPRNSIAPSTLAGQASQNELLNEMNKELGTNVGVLQRAGLANAQAHMNRSEMSKGAFEARENQGNAFGNGLGRRERGSVGRGARFVSHQTHLPPALMSQPFSANFQFQHTLPPAFQKFSKGGGLYA
jgi:hypothetical protein